MVRNNKRAIPRGPRKTLRVLQLFSGFFNVFFNAQKNASNTLHTIYYVSERWMRAVPNPT